MCGIVALFNNRRKVDTHIIKRSLIAMKHRGPDASGVFTEDTGSVVLGNNRLAFVDLQKRSNQPMQVGDWVITFNGEIYNYRELKQKLQKSGYVFKTESDTEVIIHAISEWGTDAYLKFNGCFAIIAYNCKTEKVLIARDRLGEKQLVFGRAKNGDYMFASEIKGLLVHPAIDSKPNINRYIEELIFNVYADRSETFFEGIHHFPPGMYCEYDMKVSGELKFTKYWDIGDIAIKNYSKDDLLSIIDRTKTLLTDAVSLQTPQTTRIGSILSGGLDSSFVTSLAASQSPSKRKLECFTIGYTSVINRDLKNAKRLQDSHKNIDLHEIIVSETLSKKGLGDLTSILEEPVVDTVLPSICRVYQEARAKGLKCVFNGQGSDEQWLGYIGVDPIFRLPKKVYSKDKFSKYWYDSSYFIDFIKKAHVRKKVKEIIEKNLERNFYPYYQGHHYDALTRFALKTHLAGLLYQEDRLSMKHSVEVRLPFLDTRLIELALSIPAPLKIYDGREKYILRKAARETLPNAIVKRKKQGFPHAPSSFDRKFTKQIASKVLQKSPIMNAIFNDEAKNIMDLPLRERVVPFALTKLESIFTL